MIAIFFSKIGISNMYIFWLNTCETCNIDSNYACTTIYKMSEIVGGDK